METSYKSNLNFDLLMVLDEKYRIAKVIIIHFEGMQRSESNFIAIRIVQNLVVIFQSHGCSR